MKLKSFPLGCASFPCNSTGKYTHQAPSFFNKESNANPTFLKSKFHEGKPNSHYPTLCRIGRKLWFPISRLSESEWPIGLWKAFLILFWFWNQKKPWNSCNGTIYVNVIVTLECIHLYFLCIVPWWLFREVFVI